ncbi:MAG: phage terminase large subunit family protein [Planctomycetota bacterium]|jgi:hypothetical protein
MSMKEEFLLSIRSRLVDGSLDNCERWSEQRIWTPEPFPGPLSFEKFPWQPEILNCMEPTVSVRKAAQMGFSVAALIKSLYMVDQRKTDVLYILPTRDLASDFAKARLDAMVSQSPPLRGMFIGANNVGLKTTADHAHIYIRGSVAESGLVSVPVGCAIVDEYDRCNPDSMSLVMERLAAHEKKHFFGLSTPTLPNHGIDVQYLLGTQEHFMFPCPSCSRSIELDWPDAIEICGESATDPDCHKSYYKCPRCGAKLPHETKSEWLSKAFWQPTAVAHGHRSFHLNQMYGPSITPGELVVAYHLGQADDASEVQFTNQKLGLPFLMEGARLTDAIIDECLGSHRMSDPRPETAGRQIVMGVDVGNFLDIVVAEYIYTREPGYEPHINSICKVLWSGRMAGSDFEALDQLMAEWQVQYACIDFQPETINAKAFCRRFHGYAAVVQYRKGTTAHEIKEARDDDRVPVLTVDRTAFMDMCLGRMHKGRTELPANISPIFREHVKRLTRTFVLDEFGRPKLEYVTEPGKADHQAHALALTEVAHLRVYSKATGRQIGPGENVSNL